MEQKIKKSRISGAKLRRQRDNNALSLEQLAEETEKRAAVENKRGISAKTIWRIEHGTNAHPYTIARLADALGVEPKDLLKDEGDTESPLAENICDFEDFIEERTRDFAGRGFVFDAIDNFVENHESGYFFIYGDPGIGKSSVAARLVREREYIHHFNIRAEGINRAETFLKNVCSQLIVDYELPYNSLPSDISTDGRFLNKLIGEASKKSGTKGQIVIIIDALDEVDTYSLQTAGNILYLPPRLPAGVYIIATTRRMSLNLRIECNQGNLTIDHDSSQNLKDIKEYLKTKAGDEEIVAYIKKQKLKKSAFIESMIKKSQGNFMYLRYVLPEIEMGAYKDMKFEQLPVGLENYYEDHWRRMGMMASPLPKEKIKIVYILSEVQQPVSRKMLSDFSKEDELTIQSVVNEWAQFLHKQETDGQKCFSLYHDSFRNFLNRKDIVQAAGVTIEDINGLIADNLWQEFKGGD